MTRSESYFRSLATHFARTLQKAGNRLSPLSATVQETEHPASPISRPPRPGLIFGPEPQGSAAARLALAAITSTPDATKAATDELLAAAPPLDGCIALAHVAVWEARATSAPGRSPAQRITAAEAAATTRLDGEGADDIAVAADLVRWIALAGDSPEALRGTVPAIGRPSRTLVALLRLFLALAGQRQAGQVSAELGDGLTHHQARHQFVADGLL
jgi:hypothetical protein